MTKDQLIKALEPFDDDIEITVFNHEHKFQYCPNVYYYCPPNDEARIILGIQKVDGKAVELKI